MSPVIFCKSDNVPKALKKTDKFTTASAAMAEKRNFRETLQPFQKTAIQESASTETATQENSAEGFEKKPANFASSPSCDAWAKRSVKYRGSERVLTFSAWEFARMARETENTQNENLPRMENRND